VVIKENSYLGILMKNLYIALGAIAIAAGIFFVGVIYGKNKVKAHYESETNRVLKENQQKHIGQVEEKNQKIKELNNELQKQITIVHETTDDGCLDRDVPNNIKQLLDDDKNNTN